MTRAVLPILLLLVSSSPAQAAVIPPFPFPPDFSIHDLLPTETVVSPTVPGRRCALHACLFRQGPEPGARHGAREVAVLMSWNPPPIRRRGVP